ncbi:hypothetical protein ACFUKV_32600 [Streptomyces paradoxus]|uniref:hypothetical protein n=1 Tax=Streptomyces paradoxus TaxID=66375 RepID=UPI0036443F2A
MIAADAQYALAYADEVVAYADGLGKPLEWLIVSHAHPDLFHGAAASAHPVHAPAAVRDQIASQGDAQDIGEYSTHEPGIQTGPYETKLDVDFAPLRDQDPATAGFSQAA